MTTDKDRKPGFRIEVGCPGCGGELAIEEDFFVTTCSHCGSVLRLVMPDTAAAYLVRRRMLPQQVRVSLDRFLKMRLLPLTDSQLEFKAFYYPYWKMDGLLLRLRNRLEKRIVQAEDDYHTETGYEKRATEVSVIPYSLTCPGGAVMADLPDSLGRRTDVVKLVPFSADNVEADSDVMPVTRPLDQVWQDINRFLETVDEAAQPAFGVNATELFHPTFSLVFFPYYVVESYRDGYRRFAVDGLTGRVLEYRSGEIVIRGEDDYSAEAGSNAAQPPPAESTGTASEAAPTVQFGSLGVEFHRCTTCGADLPDERSCVYICPNCHEAKSVDKTPLPVGGVCRAGSPGRTSDQLFPFWALKTAEGDDESLRLLFGGLHGSDRIVVPAFKMQNFEAMYRLAGRISAAFPRIEMSPVTEFSPRFASASVGMDRATALAEIIIYRRRLEMAANGTGKAPMHKEFRPVHADLFYAPFHAESYFFVDSVMGSITFEKSLVG